MPKRASGGKPGRHSSDEKKFVRRQENAGREDVGGEDGGWGEKRGFQAEWKLWVWSCL